MLSGFNHEVVVQDSPGSRSAPWESMFTVDFNLEEVVQTSPVRFGELLRRKHLVCSVSQGALRDPGLSWTTTSWLKTVPFLIVSM